MCAIVAPFLWSRSQPVRIFKVTGISTAARTACKISATSGSSFSSAEPAALLQTFFAGQPILISIICAPSSTHWRAASASMCASAPAICTERGSGSVSVNKRKLDLRLDHRRVSLVSISDTVRPAPKRAHNCRCGRSVTPAIGARIRLLANV